MSQAETIIKNFPILQEEIQTLLIEEDYKKAARNMSSLLSKLNNDAWNEVIWQSLILGDDFSRGNYTVEEYIEKIRPVVMEAILLAATGENLAAIAKSLSYKTELISLFFTLYLEAIPKNTPKEKAEWLKENKNSCFIYLTASPAEELGVSMFPPAKQLDASLLDERLINIPAQLTIPLFSYSLADEIYRLGSQNHLSDERIHASSRVIGHELMGLIHPNEFQKTLAVALALSDNQIKPFAESIIKNYIEPNQNAIIQCYKPISDLLERVKPEKNFNENKQVSSSSQNNTSEKVLHLSSVLDTNDSEEKLTITKDATSTAPKESKDISSLFKKKPTKDATAAKNPAHNEDSPLILVPQKEHEGIKTEKKKSFIFNIPFKGFSFGKTKVEPPGIKASIYIGSTNKNEEPQTKVVNYSDTRSSTIPFEEAEPSIDFKPLEKPASAKPAPSAAPKTADTPTNSISNTTPPITEKSAPAPTPVTTPITPSNSKPLKP